MTEQQIELSVEHKVSALDRAFMNPANRMTQATYDAEMKAIDRWAQAQLMKATPPAE
jgi:hypothetical protein